MKRTSISKLTVIILALVIMTSGLTGCKMNLPDTSKIGPGGTAESGKESDDDGESGEGGLTLEDVLASGDESEEEAGNDDSLVSDVTAGTIDDGSYYLAAAINDDTVVYVDAPEAVLKDQKASNASAVKDKSGDLEKARLAYLTAYYEGDEDSAREDLEEYEKLSLTGGQSAALKGISSDLGKIFAQFDITTYDLTAPNEADDTFVTFDVYSSANEPFTLDLTFDGDTLTDVNLSYDGDIE